jgi:type II secretory pathway component PulC
LTTNIEGVRVKVKDKVKGYDADWGQEKRLKNSTVLRIP